MAYDKTPILGLIGGVGCGKSSVARWLADHCRARVINADAVGHAALRREDVRQRLRDAFGEGIERNGEIDRPAIAARVFGDTPEHAAARRTLEATVHPVMREDFEQAFAVARRATDVDLIVFDAAILLESGWSDAVDLIAYIDVPHQTRLRRISERRGWTEEDLRRREQSQWPLRRKRAAADVVIDNSGTLEAAGRQLESYLREHRHLPAAASVSSSTHQLIN